MKEKTNSPTPKPVVQAVVAILILVVGSIAFVVAAPWILPVSVAEGPLVQRTDERSAVITWRTSRSAECVFEMSVDGAPRETPVDRDGDRCVVRLSGLAPGGSYPYGIRCGRRAIAANTLRTNKPVGTPFRFVVFGDSGKATQAQYVLAGLMAERDPDFLLHTGDVVYPDGARQRYASRFFAPYRKLTAQVTFWPCLGNHDVDHEADGAAPAYTDVFELPLNGPRGLADEHNYWFDYGDARVAVIDSNLDEAVLAEHVAPWLREVLGQSGPRWKFVALHYPPYTGGKYAPNAVIQRTLVPVFEETGVDVVFCGHDHMYERIAPLLKGAPSDAPNAVRYIVTGAGGARLYTPLPEAQRPSYVEVVRSETHSFTYVEIDGDTLHASQIDVNGALIDEWTKTKSDSKPAEPTTAPDR